MKMKKALRKLLAMCMAVMSILFIMPSTISYAEQSSQTEDTITCKIKEFDMGNKAFQIELSTNASGCGIAYYHYNYYSQGFMDIEEVFASATKEYSSTVTFTVNDGDLVYAWIIDQDGNTLAPVKEPDYFQDIEASRFPVQNYNPDIVYTNGDVIEYNANMSVDKGILDLTNLPHMTGTYVATILNNDNMVARQNNATGA